MRTLTLSLNASGAVEGARRGDVVVIVDIIDMSTSAEVALEMGALAVFGAAPTGARAPVNLNPERIGYLTGKMALKHQSQVIVVAEPRYGNDEDRRNRAETALMGVARSGAEVGLIIPNLGSEIGKLADFYQKVVLLVSDTGGVAFDTAYNNGAAAVTTATVTRTPQKKGSAPAICGVERALEAARRNHCGITVVAASANSMEDVLAAQYLFKLMMETGFLNQPE